MGSMGILSGDILSWIPPLHVGVLALLIGLVAVAGDLAESILKAKPRGEGFWEFDARNWRGSRFN